MRARPETDPEAPVLRPLADILGAHRATLASQLDAFEAYVAEPEREGAEKYPLYKWTKATAEDPAKRLKRMQGFAVHVAGQNVYSKQATDALEDALRPLPGGGIRQCHSELALYVCPDASRP